MTSPWQLPETAVLGGRTWGLHTDFRDILEVMEHLNREELPPYLRWAAALGVFYRDPVPEELWPEAMEYLSTFLRGGRWEDRPGPRLLDWQQDGPLIVADINGVAGREIRQMEKLHWWTFLGWFHGIREGQLSTVVSIRQKLARGKKLEEWEREYYRENKDLVELRRRETAEERAEKERLEALLRGEAGVRRGRNAKL